MTAADDVRILGIDASMTATGLAFAAGTHTVAYPKGLAGDRRLVVLYAALFDAAGDADVAILEELPFAAGARAYAIRQVALAQGVVRLALLHRHVPYVLVSPTAVKAYATGKGGASKPDLRMAYFQATGYDERDDNRVDAYWLREIGLARYGRAGQLNAQRRKVLDAIDWAPAPVPEAAA